MANFFVEVLGAMLGRDAGANDQQPSTDGGATWYTRDADGHYHQDQKEQGDANVQGVRPDSNRPRE